MMGLVELGYRATKLLMYLVTLTFLISCNNQDKMAGTLECLLGSIEQDANEKNIVVGQANGWTDSTALVIILYEDKSLKIPKNGQLKGEYQGNDIYFSNSNIDSLDTQKYSRIPNGIKWKKITPEITEKDFIVPPYNPINIQVEYFFDKNCFGEIVRGEGYIDKLSFTKCKCD